MSKSATAKSAMTRDQSRLDLSACDRPLPAGVVQGIEQFNQRQFYQCHDSVELAWVDEPGDVRLMYQGILQISVAFHHVQQGNWPGMAKMLARGKPKLLPFLPVCQGIDLKGLLAQVEQCESALQDLGPERLEEFDHNLFPSISVAQHL